MAAFDVAAAGLVVLLLATACTSNAKPSGAGALGTVSPTASGTATAPTGTGPSTAGSGATPTGGATTHAPTNHTYPADYAQAVLNAWSSGDTSYLILLTDADTAAHIHAFGNINHHWTHIRDDGAAGSSYDSYYNNAGDEITIRVINDEISQHHWHAGSVQSWDPMTFPAGATAYAKKLVDGWINGNKARMNLLGTTGLTGIYLALDTPSSGYTLGAPFASGPDDVEVEIKDTSTSLDTSVIIHTATLGHQHAIIGCDIGC